MYSNKKLYKNKNNKLFNKKGGYTFEEMYITLIDFCKFFNRTESEEALFGECDIAHIKGGASIKYHLMNRGIYTSNITSDIDILLIPAKKYNDESILVTRFYELLRSKIPIDWKLTNNNGLYNICIDGQCVFDITLYDPNMYNNYDETSMFSFALCKLNFNNISEYIKKLRELDESSNIDDITFTSIYFEYFSTIKGIENTQKYIDSYPEWLEKINYYKKILNQTYNISTRNSIQEFINRYKYQISNSYMQKLIDKNIRYKQKLEILKSFVKLPENYNNKKC